MSGTPTCSHVTSRLRFPNAGTPATLPPTVWELLPSYLPLADGTGLYLATVIDYDRPAPGRLGAASPHAHVPFVIEAIQQATSTCGNLKGAVFHLQPRIGLHLQGIRHRVQEAQDVSVHRSGRLQRGQCAGRVGGRHAQARSPHGRTLLER